MEPVPRIVAVLATAAVLTAGCRTTGPGGGAGPTISAPPAFSQSDTPLHPTPASAGDPYTPGDGNGGYHVEHYGLNLRITPGDNVRELDATAELTSVATGDLTSFDLDLTGLTVASVQVNGAPAAYTRQGQELTVTPATPLAKGVRFSTSVAYHGTPQAIHEPTLGTYGWIRTRDGIFTADQPSGAQTWFPCNDHPSDKASYDFTVTVPSGLQVVANGEPVTGLGGGVHSASPMARNSTITSHWRETEPMATYLATVDVGHFQIKTGRTPGGIPIIVAVDPTVAGVGLDDLYARTAEITDAWVKLFGPYPFDSTGAIYDNALVNFALETQTRPVFGDYPLDPTILAHELAHEWFGDSVSVTKWQDIWLNEGFATYFEWTWGERLGGKSVQQQYDERYGLVGDPRWQIEPGNPGKDKMFDGFAVYDRAAMTLQALRTRVGDNKFFAIVRAWAAERRGGNGTTPEFVATAERISGMQLGPLFQAWLYGTTRPTNW
jgi:aminopeptidase N